MSKKTTAKGFTIVELLIVIVVMGILATIVIVTYQGVQDKANTTKNQSNAKEVIAKAEAYNSLETGYPTDVAVFSADDADSTVKLSGEVTGVLNLSTATNGAASTYTKETRKNIYYRVCTTDGSDTGIRVEYWDYDKKQSANIDSGSGCGGYTPSTL